MSRILTALSRGPFQRAMFTLPPMLLQFQAIVFGVPSLSQAAPSAGASRFSVQSMYSSQPMSTTGVSRSRFAKTRTAPLKSYGSQAGTAALSPRSISGESQLSL